MTELITAAQMRAIEADAIASGRVTGLELMERAGQGVVDAIFEEWPEFDTPKWYQSRGPLGYALRLISRRRDATPRVGVLCGFGNNGGDGFVVARLLAKRGLKVTVFFLGPPSKQSKDARDMGLRWFMWNRRINVIAPLNCRDVRLSETRFDLFVDAVFGTGLSRALPPEVTELMNNIRYERNWQENKLVAVDILSGIHADTGEKLSTIHLPADLTVTFHRKKPGHVTGDGALLSGKVVTKDIGL